MGVEKEHIAFYGIKAEYGKFDNADNFSDDEDLNEFKDQYNGQVLRVTDYDKFRNKYNPEEDRFTLIVDGMNGDYSCIGICIRAFGQDRWNEDVDLNLSLSSDDIIELDDKFRSKCKELNIDISSYEPKLIIITHYT